jgi:hypothetical protein
MNRLIYYENERYVLNKSQHVHSGYYVLSQPMGALVIAEKSKQVAVCHLITSILPSHHYHWERKLSSYICMHGCFVDSIIVKNNESIAKKHKKFQPTKKPSKKK